MVQSKTYESPIEQIIKQLEDQEPPYRVKSIENDKVKFGFPEELKMTIREQLQQATTPIGQNVNNPRIKTAGKPIEETKGTLRLPTSSTIQQAAYWPKKEYLVVSFKSGHTYDYNRVPLVKIVQWEDAASAGSFFYYNIRMAFPYRKIG